MKVRKTYLSVEEWLEDVPSHCCSAGRYKHYATDGWKEGVSKIAKYTYNIDNVVGKRINEPAIQWDVTGVDYDIGTVLTGNPECWYDFHLPEHKMVRIMYNPSATAQCSEISLELRGAMVAGLIDTLEKAGHRTELWMVYGDNHSSGGDHRIEVLLKQPEQALDIDRIAFFFVHPKALRSLWFAMMEGVYHRSTFAYHVTEEDRKQYNIVVERLDNELSEVQIMLWIKNQLKKFGVELATYSSGD